MTKTMCIHDFLEKAVLLEPGEAIHFYLFEGGDDASPLCAGITRVDAFEAVHLLVNYFGGGDPLVLDITRYDMNLKDIVEAFIDWMPEFDEGNMKSSAAEIKILPAPR